MNPMTVSDLHRLPPPPAGKTRQHRGAAVLLDLLARDLPTAEWILHRPVNSTRPAPILTGHVTTREELTAWAAALGANVILAPSRDPHLRVIHDGVTITLTASEKPPGFDDIGPGDTLRVVDETDTGPAERIGVVTAVNPHSIYLDGPHGPMRLPRHAWCRHAITRIDRPREA